MASIDNEYIVRLLCVCFGTRMMLVSEFVPFGSLKYHLKEFKSEINAETLLTFAAQVASVCIVTKTYSNELHGQAGADLDLWKGGSKWTEIVWFSPK